jgi:acyl-CoA synthetase (NDP forming)
VLDIMLGSGEVDAVIAVVVATGVTDGAAVVERLRVTRLDYPQVPVLLVTLGGLEVGDLSGMTRYGSTTAAVRALAHAVDYTRWREVPSASAPDTDAVVVRSARERCAALLEADCDEDGWLGVPDARDLLETFGLDVLGDVVTGVDAAVGAASRLGYPVAVKLARAGSQHKSEAGLVHTDLEGPADVRRAVAAIGRVVQAVPDVLVQPMAAGVELALGVVRDPTIGPLVMVAAGGVATDVLDDRVFLLPPVTVVDAGRALRGLRLWPLLDGFRGSLPADVPALEQLVVDLARLAAAVPEVAELDLNPVLVSADGCSVVDVRLRLASADGLADVARQLRRVR